MSDLLSRRGHLTIPNKFFEDHTDVMQHIMAGAVIYRAETINFSNAIRYDLCHPAFDVCEDAQVAEQYVCRLNQCEETGALVEIQFIKQSEFDKLEGEVSDESN